MIINMVRTYPQLYLQALNILQDRFSQRQNPHSLSFQCQDVGFANDMLTSMQAKEPLTLAEDLCKYIQGQWELQNLQD